MPRPGNQLTSYRENAPSVLNSWKEIAAYLNRGVRTVQRWESELQLPVHRPKGRNRSAVLALQEELDEWLRRTPSQFKSKDIWNELFDIACDLQSLIQSSSVLAAPQTQPEGEKLLDAVNTIKVKLSDLNGNSNGGPLFHWSLKGA